MKRVLKRPVVLLFLAIFITLAAAGALFQYSTAKTLELAEALQFRRMAVAHQEDRNTFRFFYVTNRLAADAGESTEDSGEDTEDGGEDTEERFTSEREPGLRLGYFDTRIEPSLGIGMLINPSDWFQNEEIQLESVTSTPKNEFLEQLRSQVDASPRRSLLVNINGFRERFPSALRKTAFLAHVLDLNTPVLVFDWPGDQGSTLRGYRRAQRIAGESGAELAETIRIITREVKPDRLWMVANSMGGEVVVNAFTELYEDPEFNDAESEVTHVLLTAPDVSHAGFGAQYRREIQALADHLTVYVSANDQALFMSRVINRERRLGESTIDPADLDPLNPDQLEEASEVFDMLLPDSDLVTLVDITPVNRTRNFHNFSLETPEYFDELFLRLTNEEAPTGRALYRVRQPSGTEYWVLTRGR